MRTGQEPNYRKWWDENSKSWKTAKIDSEEIDAYKEEHRIPKQRKETKASFQTGGYKKFPRY